MRVDAHGLEHWRRFERLGRARAAGVHGYPHPVEPEQHGLRLHVAEAEADEVGEAVSFSMLDDTEAVYVAHSYGPARFTLNMVTTGSRIPLLPTAAGRAMLAFLDAETRDAIIADAPLTAHTAHTETSKDKLIAQLGTIRAKGYCFADAEYVEGVDSLAVPVLGVGGKVIGAISIIFPQNRYQPEDIEQVMFPKLRQCAADVGLTF